jgi:23S rRNA-/tRNA-specific pseudouridylate synthase
VDGKINDFSIETGKKTGFDPGFGVHAVHRLDKETSGIMLLAVNQGACRFVSRQVEDRTVAKQLKRPGYPKP